MLKKPKNESTSNDEIVKIVVSGEPITTEIVSGNTETDESTEPKKRGRKPNPLNYFA